VFVLAISALLLHSVDLQWGGPNPNPSQRLGHVPAMDGARNAKRGGGTFSAAPLVLDFLSLWARQPCP